MSGSMLLGTSGAAQIYNCRAGGAVRRRRWRCGPSGATLVQYGTDSKEVTLDPSKGRARAHGASSRDLGGTQTDAGASGSGSSPDEHDRVVIVTDEQAHCDRLA